MLEDIDFYRYPDNHIQQWLHWLEAMASHHMSQQTLSILPSDSMERWLSKNFFDNTDNPEWGSVEPGVGAVDYVPWVSAILISDRRAQIAKVSQSDWEQAQSTIESARTKNIVAQGSADICAMIGALYLHNFADSFVGPLPDVYDVWKFQKAMRNFTTLKLFANPADIISTPEMRTFESEFLAAHEKCRKGLDRNIVEWYFASMAFMGISYSEITPKRDCEQCRIYEYGDMLCNVLTDDRWEDNDNSQELLDLILEGLVSTCQFPPFLCSHCEAGRYH